MSKVPLTKEEQERLRVALEAKKPLGNPDFKKSGQKLGKPISVEKLGLSAQWR